MTTIMNYLWDVVANPKNHLNEYTGLSASALIPALYIRNYPDSIHYNKALILTKSILVVTYVQLGRVLVQALTE